MAAMTRGGGGDEDDAELVREIEALSHEELCQMVLVALTVATQRTGAQVPEGWETVVLPYLEATLAPNEAIGLVQRFGDAPKESIEGIVGKFWATEQAVLAALPEIQRGVDRTGAELREGWEDNIKTLALMLAAYDSAHLGQPVEFASQWL